MQDADRRFEFEIGQAVDHVLGGMRSIVVARSTTLMGVVNYNVWLDDPQDERRSRVIRGDALRAA